MADTFEKAKIINLNNNKEVVCHFNPAEFTIGKTAKWESKESSGRDTPKLVYSGGEAQDMTVTFLFDTTATGGEKDVRDEYKELVNMVKVDKSKENTTTGQAEPPKVRFHWGSFLAFDAVITKLDQKFTMFSPQGKPVRSKVTVTFKQVGETTQGQNPTTRSETRKTWMVHEGETLDWIAYQEYGDAAHWRHIAETNSLDDPRALHPGQILKLVPLP